MDKFEELESSAIQAFGPLPESLNIPERDDSEMVEWLAKDLFPGKLFWTSALGWLRWDGKRWIHVDQVLIIEYVRLAVQQLRNIARAKGLTGDVQQALARLSSKAKLKGVVEFSQGYFEKDASEFDSNPHILNLQNGVLNFLTGKFEDASPSHLVTKIAGASYVEGMKHPDIETLLSCVSPEEAEWLQVCFGQGLTGMPNPDDKLIIFKGGGSNGKSALIEAVLKAVGNYGVFLPEKTLLSFKSDHSTEKMPLRGARIAILEELPAGAVMPVKRLKDIVGTPQITARGIGKDNVTWDASHTLFISTNYVPIVEETDTGTWRRLKMLLFQKRFVKSVDDVKSPHDVVGDPTIKVRIPENESGQLDALMTWMVEGAKKFYQDGRVMPIEPQSVIDATNEWRHDSDVVFDFFTTHLEQDSASHIAVSDLLNEFNKFQAENGRSRWSSNVLRRRIEQHEELRPLISGFSRYRVGVEGLSRPSIDLFVSNLAAQYTALGGMKFKN